MSSTYIGITNILSQLCIFLLAASDHVFLNLPIVIDYHKSHACTVYMYIAIAPNPTLLMPLSSPKTLLWPLATELARLTIKVQLHGHASIRS